MIQTTPNELLDVASNIDEWQLVNPLLQPKKLNRILRRPDVIKVYQRGMKAAEAVHRWDLLKWYEFKQMPKTRELLDGQQYLYPEDYERSDWRFFCPPGRPPYYYRFVCTRLCHWLAEGNRLVASLLYPHLEWGVVSSDRHSSAVCPSEHLLFDLNYAAMGVSARSAMEMMFGEDFCGDGWEWFPEDTYDCEESDLTRAAMEFWTLCDRHKGTDDELLSDLRKVMAGDITPVSDTASDIAWNCGDILDEVEEPELVAA